MNAAQILAGVFTPAAVILLGLYLWTEWDLRQEDRKRVALTRRLRESRKSAKGWKASSHDWERYAEFLERQVGEESLRRNTDLSLGDDGRELLERRFTEVLRGSDAAVDLALWTGELDPEVCLLAEQIRLKDGDPR